MEKFNAIGAAPGLMKGRLDLGTITDQNDPQIRIGSDGLHGAGDDWSGCVVATHRVQRDLHGSFLLFRHHLATLIVAAVGTDTVRQHGLIALATVLHLNGFDALMTPPFPLTGV
jgi:hypothetical protein